MPNCDIVYINYYSINENTTCLHYDAVTLGARFGVEDFQTQLKKEKPQTEALTSLWR